MATSRRQQDVATNMFRSPANVYQALKSRPSQKLIRRSLVASFNSAVWPHDDKHSVYIRNLSGLATEQHKPSNPAAGADFSIAVPDGERWEVISGKFLLTTDATAANRIGRLIIDDGTATTSYRVDTDANQTASTARNYIFGRGVQRHNGANVSENWLPLPNDLSLDGGDRIRSEIVNLQAGDQISAISFLIRRFIDLRLTTDGGTTNFLTIPGGGREYFPLHLGGLWPTAGPGALAYQQLFHSEWDDDINIQNPSASTACIVELLIIG